MDLGLILGIGLSYWTQTDFIITKLLEMSENLLELSVKQLVIQWRLASSIFWGQAMFGMWKTKCRFVCCKVRYVHTQKELSKPNCYLNPFKR